MKIGIVRYWGRTKVFRDLRGLLGVDSLANICDDATLYNHVDGAEKTLDVALLVGTYNAVKWHLEVKPARWGKVLFVPYTYPLALNSVSEMEAVDHFDGILTFFNKAKSWDVLRKPVIETLLPCLSEEYPREKRERACVVIKALSDPLVNFVDTLSVFKRIGMRGVVSTNSAVPYCDDTGYLRVLVRRLGLDLEVTRPKNRQEYMAEISDCSVMLTMDARQSYGRWVVDAAQLGIPCVGTYSTMQDVLMRDYLVGSGEIERATALVRMAKPVPVDWGMFDPVRLRGALESKIEAAFRGTGEK